MKIVSNILTAGGEMPWWSILIFLDEPKCPKELKSKF